jgi:hypothetical protein
MNDPMEFTPEERVGIDIGRDPARLFRQGLTRTLFYLIPSLGLVVYAAISQQYGYGLVGYGILVLQELRRLVVVRRGLKTRQRIMEKYEARLRSKDIDSR